MQKKKKSVLATSTENPTRFLNSNFSQIILITLFGLLAHGLLLFTDYQVWDGWITGCLVKNTSNWSYFCEWIKDCGSNMGHLFLLPLKGVDNIYFYGKLLSIINLIFIFIFISFTIPNLFGVPSWVGLYTGVIGVTMPFFEVLGEVTFLGYTIPLLFFWIGWFMFVRQFGNNKAERLIFQSLYLALIFVGFQFNSLLVLHYALLLIFLITKCFSNDPFSVKILMKSIFSCIFMVLLPLIFWFHKLIYTPTRNYYADFGYNSVHQNIWNYFSGYSFSYTEMAKRLISPFDDLNTFFYTAALFFILLFIMLCLKAFHNNQKISRKYSLFLLTAGFILSLSALFPYIAVGKIYQAYGYDSRNGILLGFPVAVILSGIAGLAGHTTIPKIKLPVGLCLLMFFCSFGIVESNRNYLRLSGYSAKQKSIILKTKEEIQKHSDVNVVHLRDYFYMPNTINWIPAAAWSFMFIQCEDNLPLPKILVVDTRNFMPDKESSLPNGKTHYTYPKLQFSSADVKHFKYLSSLPDAMINISNDGNTLNIAAFNENRLNGVPEAIGAEYLHNKIFETPRDQSQFLKSLVDIKTF